MAPGGKIVVAGAVNVGGQGLDNAFVVRYQSNGILDSTFSADGVVVTTLGSNQQAGATGGLAVDTSGRPIVGGYVSNSTPTAVIFSMVVARFTTAGALDTTFDSDGVQTVNFPGDAGYSYGVSLAIDSTGRSVALAVAGAANRGVIPMAGVARFNVNGSLDSTFSGDGKQTTIPVSDTTGAFDADGLAITTDGKIVVAGAAHPQSGTSDVFLIRYLANGNLDTTFDADGIVLTSYGPTTMLTRGLALDSSR